MIVYRFWTTQRRLTVCGHIERTWDGWFLFGFIPLFVRLVKETKYQ